MSAPPLQAPFASDAKSNSIRALDTLNLFLADVRDGVGPYLGIYLLSVRHWAPSEIGMAMSVPGLVAILLQTPAGTWVDITQHKRRLVVLASALVAFGCLASVLFEGRWMILMAQGVVGAASTIYQPVISAITLGLVGHQAFARQMGRNEAFNHGGNVLAAVLAGLIGYYIAYEGIFYLVAVMGALGIWSVLRIHPTAIDHQLARGAVEAKATEKMAGFGEVLLNPRIRNFAISVILFHFANAAMLPLVGQRLAIGNQETAALYMSACIIVAQLVMVPVATMVARRVSRENGLNARKPIFLIGFAILPIRGILYACSANAYCLVAVQLLDGIGAGIFGVLSVIMIADLTQGTGRFNFVQGAITTATGIGAVLSTTLAGFVVEKFSYNTGFLFLAVVALLAFLFFWKFVGETIATSTNTQPVITETE